MLYFIGFYLLGVLLVIGIVKVTNSIVGPESCFRFRETDSFLIYFSWLGLLIITAAVLIGACGSIAKKLNKWIFK